MDLSSATRQAEGFGSLLGFRRSAPDAGLFVQGPILLGPLAYDFDLAAEQSLDLLDPAKWIDRDVANVLKIPSSGAPDFRLFGQGIRVMLADDAAQEIAATENLFTFMRAIYLKYQEGENVRIHSLRQAVDFPVFETVSYGADDETAIVVSRPNGKIYTGYRRFPRTIDTYLRTTKALSVIVSVDAVSTLTANTDIFVEWDGYAYGLDYDGPGAACGNDAESVTRIEEDAAATKYAKMVSGLVSAK